MAVFIGEYRGYVLCVPTSGGKAGKGHNKTTSLQIRNGNVILKQIRFQIGASVKEVAAKAKRIIDERIAEQNQPRKG